MKQKLKLFFLLRGSPLIRWIEGDKVHYYDTESHTKGLSNFTPQEMADEKFFKKVTEEEMALLL